MNKDHVFLSVHPIYARALAIGSKTVELRKTNLNIQEGQRLWIYSTSPECEVIATATISSVVRASPNSVWSKFKKEMQLDRSSFVHYCSQRPQMTAIQLKDVRRLASPIGLKKLRDCMSSFHPPQLALYLDDSHPIRRILMAARRLS